MFTHKEVFIPKTTVRALSHIAQEVAYLRKKDFTPDELAAAILHAFVKLYYDETSKNVAKIISGFNNDVEEPNERLDEYTFKNFFLN